MAGSGKLEESQKPSGVPAVPAKVHYPFWFGGSASCFAAGVTHPLDLGKAWFFLLLRCFGYDIDVTDFGVCVAV